MADLKPFAGISQETTLRIIDRILNLLRFPAGFDRSQNRARVTAAVESGTITTVATVTTCATVSNISNVDSYQGRLLVLADLRNAWSNTVARRFT